ncbi:hypothetical protein, partial [Escherichia coli]|uniref:hypothetical protein n=1 Tax=Escherichia coli TaxID=562 RepID=UPI002916F6EA
NTHFGKLELEYDQLAEMRNSMRQRTNEKVADYMQRYNNINRRIQISIGGLNDDFRDMHRNYENKNAISKFIRGLYPEGLRLAVQQNRPHTLPIAYQQALYEEKLRKEDEELRNRNYNKHEERSRRDRYKKHSRDRSHSRYDSRNREKHSTPDNNYTRDRSFSRDRQENYRSDKKEDKPTCSHCNKYGHDKEHCFKHQNAQ